MGCHYFIIMIGVPSEGTDDSRRTCWRQSWFLAEKGSPLGKMPRFVLRRLSVCDDLQVSLKPLLGDVWDKSAAWCALSSVLLSRANDLVCILFCLTPRPYSPYRLEEANLFLWFTAILLVPAWNLALVSLEKSLGGSRSWPKWGSIWSNLR